VVQASVSDAALPTVYKEAEMFVFPSEYEGFGLPILESFACGCPVIASRASCFPEVGGEAMEYFDPYAPEDIAQAMARVLLSPTRADALRRLGSDRAKAYSWQRTAELTAAAYNRLS
jgi:glycosyltransferase involved in cell wall biosynthesis